MAAAIPIITALISAAGSMGSAALGRRKSQETPMQKKQQELVDQLLGSLQGGGPFSDLFNVDEGTFQKSFVDPMKQKFESQIAPQIQQQYIASGQQRGTGLDDTLARAGVNMDQLLNQYYAQMQQGAQKNQMTAFNTILNQGAGAAPEQSIGSAMGQGIAGYMGSDNFGKGMDDIIKGFSGKKGWKDPQLPNAVRV